MAIDDERIYLPTSASNHIPHGVAYVRALPLVAGRTVADLCCGTGYGTRLLSEAAQFVTGYDYSSEAITYNQTRLLPNTKFMLADVEKLTTLDVQIITCMQGLEHLDSPKDVINRFLDKTWIVALPNDTGEHNPHHHHKITKNLIHDWFGNDILLRYFDDRGTFYSSKPEVFSNYFIVYKGVA